MSNTITSYNPYTSYTTNTGATTLIDAIEQEEGKTQNKNTDTPASSDSINLSDEAKAYLAETPQSSTGADVATNMRLWLTQQYKSLGINSAMLDDKVAVDFSGQSRAALSGVAANTSKMFTDDEVKAATQTLTKRFNDAMAPQVVIAQHSKDYAQLYQAALDYMDSAGSDEKLTQLWRDTRQTVADGLTTAKKDPQKIPDANAKDPVATLLNTDTTKDTDDTDDTDATPALKARRLLDEQLSAAQGGGKDLVFTSMKSKTSQLVDFSGFDNRTLAGMVTSSDGSFNGLEVYAAKRELDKRTREAILQTMTNSSDVAGSALALINQYSGMSNEEKSALGVTDTMMNTLVQGYRNAVSMQNTFGYSSSGNATSTSNTNSLDSYL